MFLDSGLHIKALNVDVLSRLWTSRPYILPTPDLIKKFWASFKEMGRSLRHSLDRTANMAYLIRRPALGSALQYPFLQARTFSHGLSRGAFNNREQAQQPRVPSERSIRIAAKEMSQMTSDFGLLPGTPRILPMPCYNEVSY